VGTSNLIQKLLCLVQKFCGVRLSLLISRLSLLISRLSLLISRLFHDASTVKITGLDTVKEFVMVDIHGHFQTYVFFIKEQVCVFAGKYEIQYTQISALTTRSHTMFSY